MKAKKDVLIWIVLAAVVPLTLFIGLSVGTYAYAYRYRRFCDELVGEIARVQREDSLTAESEGVYTRVLARNADSLYRELTNAQLCGYETERPEGACVRLDFGNGVQMELYEGAEGGLVVYYEQPGEDPLILDLDESARFLNVQRLVSVQWGNELLEEAEIKEET